MINPESLLNLLGTRKFEYWYINSYLPFIQHDEDAPTKEEILKFLTDNLK